MAKSLYFKISNISLGRSYCHCIATPSWSCEKCDKLVVFIDQSICNVLLCDSALLWAFSPLLSCQSLQKSESSIFLPNWLKICAKLSKPEIGQLQTHSTYTLVLLQTDSLLVWFNRKKPFTIHNGTSIRSMVSWRILFPGITTWGQEVSGKSVQDILTFMLTKN